MWSLVPAVVGVQRDWKDWSVNEHRYRNMNINIDL